jgi:hypothetical protein
VEAVASELVRWDVVPDVADLCALSQEVPDEVAELLLGSGDVLTSVQDCRKFRAVVLIFNRGVSL